MHSCAPVSVDRSCDHVMPSPPEKVGCTLFSPPFQSTLVQRVYNAGDVLLNQGIK